MSDPYKRNLVNTTFYHSKKEIRCEVVVVLDGKLENRGLNLIHPISRAFSTGTIIELIATDDVTAKPGNSVDNIAYIAFVELKNSGVLLTGDPVIWNGKEIGTIIGYDDTHMPNHQNTILSVNERIPGKQLGLKIGDEIVIKGFNK
ncbi:MAG: hypothetical protein Q8N03_10380 [Ignavibacteria bacterium]|jgi:hypothetical protein|nr:hypothetical protein [Ignavibacteria bacterium]MDP3831139.1 hypothetical protein [Ignavibacteriaceae bacterium]